MKAKDELKKMIEESESIVVLTGAGISVPSGIPDFRSNSGIYNQANQDINPEVMLSHSYFLRYPDKFFQFYRNSLIYPDSQPNIAHKTIANLEKVGKVKGVITQNIDGLHQQAGSHNVLELHGSVLRNHCLKCGKSYPLDYIKSSNTVPLCSCSGIIKPDVVLYEEILDSDLLGEAIRLIESADMLLVVGTSLLVNPAASLILYFRGKHFVIINKGETPYDSYANLVIHDRLETLLTDDLLD